jgi:hydroxymethylbilane synthase
VESADGPDLVVLAAAGLKRLGLADRVTEYLECTDFVSAVGQGALAVEARADDKATLALARPLNDVDTRTSVDAERAFLAAVGGGCLAPVSAHARVRKGHFTISAFAADPDGRTVLRAAGESVPSDGVRIAEKLAKDLLDRGAADLIAAGVGDGSRDE